MSRQGSYSSVSMAATKESLVAMPSEAEFLPPPATSPTQSLRSRPGTATSNSPSGYISPHASIQPSFAHTVTAGYDPERASNVPSGRPQTPGQRAVSKAAVAFNFVLQKQLFLIRLPYIGIYRHYIEKPTKEFEFKMRSIGEKDFSTTILQLAKWREKILEQLTIVIVACTLIITADIAALAWPSLSPDQKEGTPGRPDLWVTIAMLHSSLALSVSSILLALQQQGILKSQEITTSIDREKNAMAAEAPKIAPAQGHWFTADESQRQRLQAYLDHSMRRDEANYRSKRISMAEQMIRLVLTRDEKSKEKNRQFKVSGFRLYVWQAPAMLMSYAACQFVGGFALHVIFPLFVVRSTGWTPEARTALIVLIMGMFSLVNFVFPAWLLNTRYLEWKTGNSDKSSESK